MKDKLVETRQFTQGFGQIRQVKENDTLTSNVAWFKLAEFIRRGEKERALSLYRLLTHSLPDKSFLKKLEADIWFVFDIQQAQLLYEHAANLYKQDGKIMQSLLIFEKLAYQFPKNFQYQQTIIEFCKELQLFEKMLLWQLEHCTLLLEQGSLEKAKNIFITLEHQLKDAQIFLFHRLFVIAALKNQYAEQKTIEQSLYKAIDGLLRTGAQQETQQFLSTVQGLNSLWHKDAIVYLEKQTEK
ncbi:MAG: hypothetical protein LVQ75_04750 [Candidatus Babeliales bacterium]|jgi:hypothetical protein